MKLSELTRALLESGIEDARGEARLLFSHFGGFSRGELFGTDPKSLYMLNQELNARVYSAPSLVL